MEKLLEIIQTFDLVGIAFRLVGAILILIIGLKLASFIVKLIAASKGFSQLDPAIQSFSKSFIGIILKAVVIFTAVGTLGIPMASFITLLGTAGVAVGLSLQGGLSNIAGGIIVLLFKPYGIGDFIEFGGNSGSVSEINIFHTKLTTVDNKEVVIPNGSIANGQLTNYSKNPTRRVDLTFSTSYNADIQKVTDILLGLAEKHALTLKDPAPFAALSAHGDSALTFVLRVWVKAEDYWTVNFDLLKDVKQAFDENGIEIPYPQLDVHVNNK